MCFCVDCYDRFTKGWLAEESNEDMSYILDQWDSGAQNIKHPRKRKLALGRIIKNGTGPVLLGAIRSDANARCETRLSGPTYGWVMTTDDDLKTMHEEIAAIRTPTARCPVCERLVRTNGAFLADHPDFPATRPGQTIRPCTGSGRAT